MDSTNKKHLENEDTSASLTLRCDLDLRSRGNKAFVVRIRLLYCTLVIFCLCVVKVESNCLHLKRAKHRNLIFLFHSLIGQSSLQL